MKKIIAVVGLSLCSAFAAQAHTHFTIAGEGEIVISSNGKAAAINNDRLKNSEVFQQLYPMMHENGCDIQVFNNVNDAQDMLSVTLCERNKPLVKFGRYYGKRKVGGWLVDAERYMYFDK